MPAQAGIQYSLWFILSHADVFTGSPAFAGDDSSTPAKFG
jgi:hypothetical protein